MAPVVAKVATKHRNILAVAKLDMDINGETVKKYNVNGTPTYIIFEEGKVVGRFAGARPEAAFVELLLNAINN